MGLSFSLLLAARENYDISTHGLTDRCSASELPRHIAPYGALFTGLAPARGSTSSWELPSPIGVQSTGFELMTLGTTRQPEPVVLTLYLALERANKTGKSQTSYLGCLRFAPVERDFETLPTEY